MFVLLAIDSIVERAVGEAIGVIPRLSAYHPSSSRFRSDCLRRCGCDRLMTGQLIYSDAEPHFLTIAAKRPGYPGYGQV